MQELIHYLRNNKVTKDRLYAEVRDSNFKILPKRNIFVDLCQYSNDFLIEKKEPRLIALSGLRGVGKTTLMWQTAEHINKEHTQNIYFINAEYIKRMGFNLFQAFRIFEENILQKQFHELQEPVVFLIDEVHEADDWDKDLKILYDKCKQAFVLCTGSSALLLHKSPDLASRWTLEKIFPFSFSEFLNTKIWIHQHNNNLYDTMELSRDLYEALFFSENFKILTNRFNALMPKIEFYFSTVKTLLKNENLASLLDDYISFYNIVRFLQIGNKEMILTRIIELFERVLSKDIPVYSAQNNETDVLFRLLMRLALSDEVNYQSLARDLKCKEADVERFINTLNKAEILNVFLPYGGIKSKTGQNIKPFFMSPSLRHALYTRIYGNELHNALRAKLYEDIVAMCLRRNIDPGLLSFGVGKEASPDFIIDTMDSPVVLEVGINKKSKRQISKYEKSKRYGIIVNSQIEIAEFKGDCLFVPLSWLLLL